MVMNDRLALTFFKSNIKEFFECSSSVTIHRGDKSRKLLFSNLVLIKYLVSRYKNP